MIGLTRTLIGLRSDYSESDRSPMSPIGVRSDWWGSVKYCRSSPWPSRFVTRSVSLTTPRIRLNMESANGTFDWSLGLARNVSFVIGDITLYFQVHVIASPSYAILLGQPFDVLTESVIRNFANEDQTITITDPNSGKQCNIPTFPRGVHMCRQDF